MENSGGILIRTPAPVNLPTPLNQVETDFEAEARLDPAIQFPQPLSQHPLAPRNVFLTGGTGFLGSYLLDELLRRTEADVYCLVRATDAAEGLRRIENQLRAGCLWDDAFTGRVHAIVGDLERPGFGLSDELFLDLAARIDVVFHNGGWINMAFAYERLKPVNVGGTVEVLRFAGTVSTKPVHFISSIAVFFSGEHENGVVLKESDTPHYHPSLKSGYSRSKWVADRLVAAAQSRGLPTSIYRPVRIMGHSRTGGSNDVNDILPILLKGCILLGSYPDFDIKVTMVPVDYLCGAVVRLSGQQKSGGRAFHFSNPAPIQWTGLMKILQDLGYPLRELPYSQWWQELKTSARLESAEKELLSKLILALTAPHFLFYNRPPFDDSHTREGLAGTGISCPPVNRDLIGVYMAAWQKSGYVPLPAQAAAV